MVAAFVRNRAWLAPPVKEVVRYQSDLVFAGDAVVDHARRAGAA
jgi:hypothetical protein